MNETERGTLNAPPMTRSSRRKTPKPPAPRPTQRAMEPELDVDPTERFRRTEDEIAPEDAGPMILSVPPGAEPSDLALTQPLPKASDNDFDEDLIRTREMPMADDDWLQEMLESGERAETRPRIPSRPGKEITGLFPHPAATTRTAAVAKRSPSQEDLPPARIPTPPADTDARIRTAYRQYFAMCQKHAQAVVGEEAFAQRLRDRLAKLEERYPRGKIEFRPVVDEGVVRVRVLLACKKG
jgi:hypothetical protein